MSDSLDSFVVGTAGHIDHGKSSLVKALTGIDPDRLEEEKRRGMTIDLGFAYFDLPSGRHVGIVDVPGHQRFLKNMLAGVHGMDAVMLVVAADEGPMPQTREHLAIIDLLGIEHGVVVVTKADLVDAEWLHLVREELARALASTSLRRAVIVPVSAVTGYGLQELQTVLDTELATTASRPDLGRPRLPVDRSFAMAGFGTVVTGTLVGGVLKEGDEVTVMPQGRRARIRGLQQHNKPVAVARPGSRTAVNLSGIDRAEIERGAVLAAPASIAGSRRLDAHLTVLQGAARPVRHRDRLLLYHGTAEIIVEVSLLENDVLDPGQSGWAQLFAETSIVALAGDRFILRSPAPAATVAGGVIVDTAPRRHRRRDPAVLAELPTRERGDPAARAVLELAKHSYGMPNGDLSSAMAIDGPRARETVDQLVAAGAIRRVGAVLITRDGAERLEARIREALTAYHTAHPLRPGMPKEELRSRTSIPATLFDDLLGGMQSGGILLERGREVAMKDHQPELSAEQQATIDAVLGDLRAAPFAPPPLSELIKRHALSPALLQHLVTSGQIVRLNDDTAFARAAYDDAVAQLRAYLVEHHTLTVAAARDLLGSSRRYVLPLLEWLDAQKVTRRVGDDRILRA